MRWTIFLLAAASVQAQAQADDPAAIARSAAEQFAQGRFPEVRAHFNAKMQDAVSEDMLQSLARTLFSSAGTFQEVEPQPVCTPVREFHSCVVKVRFSGGEVPVRLTIASDGQIAGLFRVLDGTAWAAILISPLLTLLPTALIFHFLPVMRKDNFFAVRVTPDFRASPDCRKILTRYRLWNVILTIAGTLLMLAGILGQFVSAILAGPLLHIGGMLAAMFQSRSRVWPHRTDLEPVLRSTELTPSRPLSPWTRPLWILPALILGGAALYLAAHWNSIPDSYPVHWGPGAKPDRWESKSFKSVFRFPLLGASVLALLYANAGLTLFGARRSPAENRMLRAFSISILGIMTAISLLFAVIPLSLLSVKPERIPLPMGMLAAFPILLILLSIIPMWRASRTVTGGRDHTPDECWRFGGQFYLNADDPAWMVRSRIGFGFTPNLANPLVRILAPLFVGQFVLVVIYVTT